MNSALQYWQPQERLERNDRRVGKARFRLPAGASEHTAHRAAFLIEEALRLMTLPGEEQGRVYYFRRLALQGIRAGAALGEWIERTQATMLVLAMRAVHGADTRAASADAVFFHSQEEALEWLLGRVLRHSGSAVPEWFAPMICNSPVPAEPIVHIVAIVERLRSLPAGWFAAAVTLLQAVEADSAILPLLASMPERIIQLWLRELGGARANTAHSPSLSARHRRILVECLGKRLNIADSSLQDRDQVRDIAARTTGIGTRPALFDDAAHELPPYLVWLAALAIIAEEPAELSRGSAVAKAHGALRQLAQSLDQARSNAVSKANPIASIHRTKSPTVPDETRPSAQDSRADAIHSDRDLPTDGPAKPLEPAFDCSLATSAGGLYFLLNSLRHLGIAETADRLPYPVRSIFIARLISSLARAARVSLDDPALLWVAEELGSARDADTSECNIDAALCWPRGFLRPPQMHLDLDRVVRVWTLAVRRWCWLTGRLTLLGIACRPGRILLTRTDLDVTLSMDTVDLRLRRLGLDLDPGWLPWFGRVVRFHYTTGPSPRKALESPRGAA